MTMPSHWQSTVTLTPALRAASSAAIACGTIFCGKTTLDMVPPFRLHRVSPESWCSPVDPGCYKCRRPRRWAPGPLLLGCGLHAAPTSRPLQPIRKDLVIRFRRQRLAREAIMAAKEISVKKYVVRLSGEERERLETLIRKGKSPARRVLKARILLKADVSEAGKGWSDNRIIEALETSPSMVYRVRKQLVEEGFEAVLSRKPRAMPAIARIFDGEK